MEKKDKDHVPECCKGCLTYEAIGKECWVYWDLKKKCTMNTSLN